MKRPPKLTSGVRFSDTLLNFTHDQLRLIGSVAMVYNSAEHALHEIAGTCIRYPGNSEEITTRINGAPGLIAIIRSSMERYPFSPSERAELDETLQCFTSLKTYRDLVVHATPLVAAIGLGSYRGKQASRVDVLLTEKALRWLTEQLQMIRYEMGSLHEAIENAEFLSRDKFESDEHKTRVSAQLQAALAQHRRCRAHYKKNDRLPEFPTEQDALKAMHYE